MSVFEYLAVFITLTMGLGATHLFTGLSKLIHARDTVKLYWVHSLWTLNTLIYIVIIWWGMFWWDGLDNWNFFQFLFIVTYAVMLFFLASLLYPWSMPVDFDCDDHFYRTRHWFFGVMSACWLVDYPETVYKAAEGVRGLPEGYLIFWAIQLSMMVLGTFIANRVFHAVFAVVWPVLTLSFVSITTLSQIAS